MDYNHDDRLRLLKNGQYRLWHDAHNILIPKGQSTTKPLMPEIVQANVKVYGEIWKSFFNRPWVDFTNAQVDTERFDRYKLQFWRDELPFDNPLIDYHFDMGLVAVTIRAIAEFEVDGIFGRFMGDVPLRYYKGATWVSDTLHFNDYNLQHLVGDFYVICNPSTPLLNNGQIFNTGEFVQNVNLPVDVVVENATIKNGNSQMPILLQNELFPLKLNSFTFEVLGGE